MTKSRRTLATAGPLSEVAEAAERALAGQPRAVIHTKGCLEDPMWPSLAAYEIGEMTGMSPEDVKALASEGWMPSVCFIREGDQFAFRASAVAWCMAYFVEAVAMGLGVIEHGTLDIDMNAREAEAARVRTSLTRLTPELLRHSFVIEVLQPGGLALLKYEFEFAPAIAMAAEVWWRWIVASYENRSAQ